MTSETRTDTSNAYAFPAIATTSRAYVANGLNQYASVAANAYAYDANGNLTSDGAGGNAYTYDIENRLVKAVAGSTTTNLLYDPLGRLVELDQGTAASVRRTLYDGEAMVAVYDSNDNWASRYIHGSNAAADDPLVWYAGAGLTTRRYLHADRLGSIVAITESFGSGYAKNAYDEYGVPAPANTGRFQYTGQMWLPQLGMYYYKSRLYSAQLGRFMQVDTIGYDGGMNFYAYVEGDPVNGTDFSGEVVDTIADIGFLVYDVYKLATEGATPTNVGALGADALAAIIPGVTGGGLVVRGARSASEAARAERVVSKVERTASGRRVGDFTRAEKAAAKAENKAQNGGRLTCNDCGRGDLGSVQSKKGVPTPDNQAHVHHDPPFSTGITRPDRLGHTGGGIEHTVRNPAPIEIVGWTRLSQ